MARRVFQFTATAPGRRRRPYISVALSFGSERLAPAPMLIDTGSDRCTFEIELAYRLGINPAMEGILGSATGLGGREQVAVMPIDLTLPQLERQFRVMAQFKPLREHGLNEAGILGWDGLLNEITIEFIRGSEFVIEFK